MFVGRRSCSIKSGAKKLPNFTWKHTRNVMHKVETFEEKPSHLWFFSASMKPMISPADRLNGLREELRVALGPLLRLEASLREVPTGHMARVR